MKKFSKIIATLLISTITMASFTSCKEVKNKIIKPKYNKEVFMDYFDEYGMQKIDAEDLYDQDSDTLDGGVYFECDRDEYAEIFGEDEHVLNYSESVIAYKDVIYISFIHYDDRDDALESFEATVSAHEEYLESTTGFDGFSTDEYELTEYIGHINVCYRYDYLGDNQKPQIMAMYINGNNITTISGYLYPNLNAEELIEDFCEEFNLQSPTDVDMRIINTPPREY